MSDDIGALISSLSEMRRQERATQTFSCEVILCTCGDAKYRSLEHAHVLVTDSEKEVKEFFPIFSREQGTIVLARLEAQGFLKPDQVSAATSEIKELIVAEWMTWPKDPGLEDRFILAHKADDMVRALFRR